MLESLAALPFLLAQNAPASPSPWSTLLPLLPIIPLFYFLMIRPRQIEDKKRQAMIDALKKNDRVITTAGIYGTVVALDSDHDRVVLRVDDDRGVKLTFSRSSVLKVVESSQEKAADPA
jgi:preprotein translocase subunit YajC